MVNKAVITFTFAPRASQGFLAHLGPGAHKLDARIFTHSSAEARYRCI